MNLIQLFNFELLLKLLLLLFYDTKNSYVGPSLK